MNNVLISDPFLFPPSGEDIFRGPILPNNILEYSKKQFIQEWEIASLQAETVVKSYNLWPACLSSPTISSSSEDYLHNFEQMEASNNNWMDATTMQNMSEEEAFDLSDLPLADKSTMPFEYGSTGTSADDIFDPNSLEELNFNDFDFSDLLEKNPAEKPEKMENSWSGKFPQLAEPVVDQLQLQQALFQTASMNLMDSVPPTDISPLTVKAEETCTSSSRSRRKTQQTSRLASDSPAIYTMEESSNIALIEPEVKPDVRVLSRLNGTNSRKRVASTSNEPTSSSANNKRKRKYELEDDTDTSVKNAKAAKMNRDKKKKEMALLKSQVDQLTATVGTLEHKLSEQTEEFSTKLQQETAAKVDWEAKYKQEKEKNLINNGLTGQLTNAKRVLELIVPTLSHVYGQMNVEISEAFESIPVRTDNLGNIVMPLTETQSYDDGIEPVSTFTTFHISTDQKTIKVDYNPHLL